MKQEAKVSVRYEMSAHLVGRDGYVSAPLAFDDSFQSWRTIVRWNLHYHHWRALAMNARDLLTKIVWRKLWLRSS